MAKTSVIVVGTGGFGRYHIGSMIKQEKTTRIAGFVEIAEESRAATRKLYADAGKKRVPPFYDTIAGLVKAQGAADCALIVTPHKFHVTHILDSFKAGMDVLVEKPMVLNESEAKRVIRARDRTGRLLSVAFPGSFSVAVQKARELIAAGEIGPVVSISAHSHQNWKAFTVGKWRQDPEISGGGFLFDTGSHMINTVVDLAGADVAELAAVQDNRGAPVEITSAVSGTFKNGVFFALCAAGDSVNCQSRIVVMGDKGVLITGAAGELLQIIRPGKPEPEAVPAGPWMSVWERFLLVRKGKLANPCPAEVGLRFARFMDLVRESAAGSEKVRAR